MNSSIEYTTFNQMSFENNDRTAYSDLNPLDGGQSLRIQLALCNTDGSLNLWVSLTMRAQFFKFPLEIIVMVNTKKAIHGNSQADR